MARHSKYEAQEWAKESLKGQWTTVMTPFTQENFVDEDGLRRNINHMEGYNGSTLVRVGNGAYNQLQLDIYGELMGSVYLYNKYGAPISYDFWTHLSRLTDWVVDNWERPDEGIWEVREGQGHFVYSKFMCWVAIDRAIRLADKTVLPR